MSHKKIVATFRKLHKWPGVIITIFAIHFALSGIIMNHRSFFSGMELSRKWLPNTYEYQNWNQAALRGGVSIGKDSLLLFGNIGAWTRIADRFTDFNQGFPKGIDNRKINQLIRFKNEWVAATQFGLFRRRDIAGEWQDVPLPQTGERLVDLFVKQDTLMILSRSNLLKSTDLVHFDTIILPAPEGYTRSAGLFNTLWELHSGELFGTAGKLLVDLLGIVTILLSVTGLLHFFLPSLIKRKKRISGSSGVLPLTYRQNLRWHNVVGYTACLFLIINTMAGMFLRPPLLIPIVNTRVGIIPRTHLDNDNPWNDKLRRGTWNEHLESYLFSTSEGFYAINENLTNSAVRMKLQPPVSLMGCNVLVPIDSTGYLIGSFSGLFAWDAVDGRVEDFFSGKPYEAPSGMSRPVSANMVTGYVKDELNQEWIFDYNQGIQAIGRSVIWDMPTHVKEKSPISLWNLSLEIHTGRILEPFIGMFYLLYIPLAGICVLMVLISGFAIWLLSHRIKRQTSK